MKKSDIEKSLQALADVLREDRGRDAPERRYPQQALPALHHDRVLSALAKKMETGEKVNAVVAFGHNPFTRLNHTLFILGTHDGGDSTVGILVITDSSSKVVGLVEDFEIPTPGSTVRLPISRPSGSQPFVLQQPSMAEQLLRVGGPLAGPMGPTLGNDPSLVGYTPGPDDGPQPWPWPGGSGPIPWPGGGGRVPAPGGVMDNTTECSWTTTSQTIVGYSCKQITGLFVPSCDAWGNDYVTDTQTDTEVDDSGADSLFGKGLNFPW